MSATSNLSREDLLAFAFENAWHHLSETRQIADETIAKAALSQALLDGLDGGERNEVVLVAYALAHIDRAASEIRQRTGLAYQSGYSHS